MIIDADAVVSPTAPTVPLETSALRATGGVRRAGAASLALIVPSDEGDLMAQAMENWYQACTTDEPFALELVGTRSVQGFVLRASSPTQLELLCKQLEAQYPQCEISPISPLADPLRLQPGEYALIGTFGLLQPSWKPLKVFPGKALSEPGSDPLVNLLAAMEAIGADCRMVAQLALMRAPESWLGADLRKTVEHPLQYERDALSHASQTVRSDAEQGKRLVGILALLFAGLLLSHLVQIHAWFLLTLLAVGSLLGTLAVLWWRMTHGAHPIYDMKLITEKMAKAGFYGQLRVIIMAHEPIVPASSQERDTCAQLGAATSDAQKLHKDSTALQNAWTQLSAAHRAHTKRPKKHQQPALLLQQEQRLWQIEQAIHHTNRDSQRLRVRLKRLQHAHTQHRQARMKQQKHLFQAHTQTLLPTLTGMETAYRQFTQASSNGFVLQRRHVVRATEAEANQLVTVAQAFAYASIWKRLLHRGAFSPWVLNSLELSGLFHLPQSTADVPLVQRVSGKHLLFPPDLSHSIQQAPAPLPPAVIGTSKHRRHYVPVVLPFDALFSHKAAFGMSRSGKTVLMLLLTWAAMQRVSDPVTPQPGVFAIDPHRDFVMDLLKLIAPHPELANRLVLLDMTDTQYPVALNPLDASMGFTRDQAVSNAMSSFQEVWRDFWGPRMSYFLNAICLLLYTLNQDLVRAGKAEHQYTLLDINPLLQYKDYALNVLTQLNMKETWHQELLAWWKHTYFTLPTNSSFRQEVIMPILSKMGVFNDNAQLRNIVGQPVTRAPVHLAITEGKIVLCALSARDMSEEAVNILGSTLVNLLHSAFTLQQPLPLTRRRKVFCALDEFHAFSGSQLDRMLSEDAKLGCSMLLSTQNLKRLNTIRDGLMEMVFSTCQQLFAFRVSAADALLIEAEMQERITQKHIISQPALHCYARLSMAGYPIQIVSAHLARPASWGDDPVRDRQVEDLLAAAHHQNLPVAEVERRYGEHLTRFLDVTSYADKIAREVRAAEKNKEEIEDAARRANAGPGSVTAPAALPDALTPATPSSNTRNRHRSRHRGRKHPLGDPPPVVEERDTTGNEQRMIENLAACVQPLP